MGWRTEIAARPLDPQAPVRRVVELAAALAAAAVFFDVVITWAALHHGLGWEQNPFVASVMHRLGVTPTLLLGGILRAGIVAGLAALALWAARSLVRTTTALVLGGGAVVGGSGVRPARSCSVVSRERHREQCREQHRERRTPVARSGRHGDAAQARMGGHHGWGTRTRRHRAGPQDGPAAAGVGALPRP
ncbi:MAG: hypothetical protein U0W40_13160 [Acidimicrobiia bacterium]